MATDSLTVLATGAFTNWTVGLGTRPSCIALPDDGDSSYIHTSVLDDTDTYTFSELIAESITTVAVISRCRNNDAGNSTQWKAVTYINPNLVYGSTHNTTVTSYANFNSGSIARPGGGSWTPADFATGSGLEFGVRRESGGAGSNNALVTTINPQITYVPAGLGIMICNFTWLPPLLAVGHLLGGCLCADVKFIPWVQQYLMDKVRSHPSFGFEFSMLCSALRRPVYV